MTTAPATQEVLPATSAARIVGVDVARGLAVLGMFGAHIGLTEAFEWTEPGTWLDLVHGRSSILFAVLAGVSIAIISGRRVPLEGDALVRARVRILIRAVIIFALGGLLEYLGTGVAVILPTYAALFVLSLPFLRWRPRKLFITAAIIAVAGSIVLTLFVPLLPRTDTYLGGGAIVELMITGFYPGIVWIAFVLAGLGLGRLELGSLAIQLRMLVVGVILAAVAYSAGGLGGEVLSSAQAGGTTAAAPEFLVVAGEEVDLTGQTCDTYDNTSFCYPPGYYDSADIDKDAAAPAPADSSPIALDPAALLSIEPHSGTPFEVVGSGGFAIAVIALSLLATRPRVLRTVLYPVAAVGSMALTAYTLQIVAIAALGEVAWAYTDNWLYFWFVLAALAGCTAWRLIFGRGILERFLTWVSHRAAGSTPADRLEGLTSHKENTQK